MAAPEELPPPLRLLRALGLFPGAFYRPSQSRPPEQLLELYGFEGCPSCIDPNSGVEMYESEQIVGYLNRSYGVV